MNLYPVKTTIEGRIVRNCRLVAEDGGSILWQWDRDKGEAVVLRESPDQPQRVGATQSWQIEDLVIDPQRGCGCQHPMYRFVPPEVQVR